MLQLNDRQQLFVMHYLTHFNGAQAAREAGYSAATANVKATALLATVNIQEALTLEITAKLAPIDAKAEDVLQADLAIAFSDIGDLVTWGGKEAKLKPSEGLDPRVRRTVAAVEEGQHGVKIRLHPKHPSLERLAKRFEIAGQAQAVNRIETVESQASAAAAWLREAKTRWSVETVDELVAQLEAELDGEFVTHEERAREAQDD